MEHKVSKIKLSPETATQKMRNWCAYQERSQEETRMKLFGFGLRSEEVEEIIAELIGENYLNEERFTKAFVGGKFRIKHWGKIKIKVELKKHKIPEKLIQKALQEIDPEEYLLTLQSLISKKMKGSAKTLNQKEYFSILRYLMSRGFETDLIKEELQIN